MNELIVSRDQRWRAPRRRSAAKPRPDTVSASKPNSSAALPPLLLGPTPVLGNVVPLPDVLLPVVPLPVVPLPVEVVGTAVGVKPEAFSWIV